MALSTAKRSLSRLEHSHRTGVNVVLDIGGDVGALVLYTAGDLLGAEIEVSRVGAEQQRTHSQVLERQVAGARVCAAVYPALKEGVYRICADDPARVHEVRIVGGTVTELDWRRKPPIA